MFVKNISGLQNVKYVDQSGISTKLTYSNGYYAIPEKFSVAPVPVVEQKQDNSWIYWIIGIVFILLIGGLVFYFMRKKK
jgi:LPXTG-motif cell wall-anchored protein